MSDTVEFIQRGSVAFRRTNLAMFAAGFATFALMYCVQPLLPVFAAEFQVTPMVASLALSVTTFTLAGALLIASALSEAWGRKAIMAGSIIGAALLTMLSATIPRWGWFLVVRAAIGLVLSGLPAVAMGYLSEEMHPKSIGLAMGLYVGGTAFGGMVGRLLTGVLADAFGWRWAVVAVGAMGLVSGLIFAVRLPPSRHFARRTLAIGALARSYRAHLADPALRLLFAEAFLIMGAFVTVYNYITFRLLAAPFYLSHSLVSWIFLVYLLGSFSSSMVGRQVERFGRSRMLLLTIGTMGLGALVTLSQDIGVIVTGVGIFTCGFFGAHTIASSWVGSRARTAKAQAASLYLFSYYLGSSVSGTVGGIFWSSYGWQGVVLLIFALLGTGLCLYKRLARLSEADCAAGNPITLMGTFRS